MKQGRAKHSTAERSPHGLTARVASLEKAVRGLTMEVRAHDKQDTAVQEETSAALEVLRGDLERHAALLRQVDSHSTRSDGLLMEMHAATLRIEAALDGHETREEVSLRRIEERLTATADELARKEAALDADVEAAL